MRRVDAPTRANTPIVQWDERNGLVKVNPIAAWSDEEFNDYIAANGILENPLVSEGYLSIGCAPCTAKPLAGRRPAQRPLGRPGQDRMWVARMTATIDAPDRTPAPLDALGRLESEAIHIMREVAGEFDRPVILFSGGKDSTVLLHLAVKAFWPAPVPFPLLHVDTGHNFDEVIEFRDRVVERYGLRLVVAHVQDWIDDGRLAERAGRHPQPAADRAAAGHDHRAPVRRGVRRRAPRRGAGPRQGADLQPAQRVRPVGAAPAASGAVEPLQRPAPARASTCGCSRCPTGPSWTCGATSRARASSCRRSTTRTSARSTSATACG